MKKRILSLLLCFCLLFSVFPTAAMAVGIDMDIGMDIELRDEDAAVDLASVIEWDTDESPSPFSMTYGLTAANDNAPPLVDDVYQLSTADDLIWFAEQVNTGVGTAYNAVLVNDIDMTGVTEWTSIGGGQYNYTGTFNGGGYSIKNWTISATDTQFVGLFGKVIGTVKNLTMDESCSVNVNITESFDSNIWIASMICVTRAGSVIENCHNEADYTLNAVGGAENSTLVSYVGGVLGQHSGSAINCSNSGAVSYTTAGGTTNAGNAFIGGIVSRNYNGSIKDFTNSGTVSVSVTAGLAALSVYAGGVAGYTDHAASEGTMTNCANTAALNITTDAVEQATSGSVGVYAGGICGRNTSLTTNCSNSGAVTVNSTPASGQSTNSSSTSVYIGGLFGSNGTNSVEDCVNTGAVTLTGHKLTSQYTLGMANYYVGGIAGRDSAGSIQDCKNTGKISIEFNDEYDLSVAVSMGGIVGEKNGGVIQNCVNSGEVVGKLSVGEASQRKTGVVTGEAVGGIVGLFEDATIENCSNTSDITLLLANETDGSLGGIAGISYAGSILSCENSGKVIGTSAAVFYVGGIVGDNYTADEVNDKGEEVGFDAVVDSVINRGEVHVNGRDYVDDDHYIGDPDSAPDTNFVGGIVGHNYTFLFDSTRRYAYIINAQNLAAVTANDATAGGVAGINIGYIYNSCNNGDISGKTAAGIAPGYGYNSNPKFENCYSSGTVTGTDETYYLTASGRNDVVSYCYWLDIAETAVPTHFSFCDSFGEAQTVSYNGGETEISLLDALNNKSAEHSGDIYGWREWTTGENGYPKLGDYLSGSGDQARYQKEPGGEWITSSLRNALRDVYDGGTVELLTNVDLAETIIISKDVTITSSDASAPNVITSSTEGHNALIRIRSGEINIDHVLFDGGYTSGTTSQEAMIVVQGFSTLTLGEGTELRNNCNTPQDSILDKDGGGLNASQECVVILDGCTIYDNQSKRGGGVVLNNGAYLLFKDGSISDNIATNGGGGVMVYNGDFTMQDGEISGNATTSTSGYGGGVYINVGTFTMFDGSIDNNTSNSYGGGIFQRQAAIQVVNGPVVSNSFVYLYGGDLTGNSADVGGAISINGNPTWQWNGVGTWGDTVIENVNITGNTAATRAGGIDINPGNVVRLSGLVEIQGNTCTADSKLSDVVLRNTTAVLDPAGVLVVNGALAEGTAIHVDTLFKESNPSDVKALIAQGTNSYAITEGDYDKFECTNPDYVLILDTEANCIWLIHESSTSVVTFDTQGGSEIEPVRVETGNTVEKPTDPTRAGYTFVDWFTSEDGGTTLSELPYDFDTPVTEDLTLYAKWEEIPSYTVTYDLNGGTGTAGEDYSAQSVPVGTEITVKEAPTRDGYTFTGWSDGTATYQPEDTITVTSDITLTAQWEKDEDPPIIIPIGTAKLTKVDADDHSIVIPGVKFELYRSTGRLVGTYTTDQNGEIKVSGLVSGSYFWKEVGAADGYVLDETEYAFTVSAWQTTSIEVENEKENVDEPENPGDVPDVFTSEHYAYIVGYSDGLVHPEANITRAEVATIFFRLLDEETRNQYMTRENSFSDVTSDKWYNTAVSTMAAMGIVTGRPGGIFDPNANITRAEFAAIAARFDANGNTTGASFTDINDHWAQKEINIAANNGWVLGYEDGTFRPDQYITRAEAMTMVNRVLQRIPESANDLHPDMIVWPDNMDTSKWYYLMVQEATNSHDYVRKDNGYESWISLRETPDWTELERVTDDGQ